MKILLAGPGTGKTTNIKTIIEQKPDLSAVLILSFTNATVNDLKKSLLPIGVSEDSCMTLHKFAVKYNHDKSRHVLEFLEETELRQISHQTEIGFNELCNFLSATTFDQMIERFVVFAKANPAYLKDKLAKYSTLIVDEYQDFNENEQALIDLLTNEIEEIYILGDDDQCIYDFKDASNKKIIELYSDPAHEKVAHENNCYRCPDIVVEKATKLIKNNVKRVDKEWKKTNKPGSLTVKQFATNADGSDYILDEVQKILKSSVEDQILILSPVGFFVDDLVERFSQTNIEYRNYFAGKISPGLIIKSWALKILFGQFKYLNLVLIGYKVLNNRAKYYSIIKKQYDTGQNFDELYQTIKSRLADENKIEYDSIVKALETEYFKELAGLYEKSKGDTENEKLENLFVSIDEEPEQRVSIMSIHKSKGLGAEHVFMIGLIEGIIPNKARGNDTIENQRRLFYVGMTRAKKSLHLISSIKLKGEFANRVNKPDFKFDYRSKMWNGRSSRFIEEISR